MLSLLEKALHALYDNFLLTLTVKKERLRVNIASQQIEIRLKTQNERPNPPLCHPNHAKV